MSRIIWIFRNIFIILFFAFTLQFIVVSSVGAVQANQWGAFSIKTFENLGIELDHDISNTYFAWDAILIQWRVTNKKEYAFLYLQNISTKEETTELVRTDMYGNFQIPVSLPRGNWKYYIIIASGNSFTSSTPETLFLVPRNNNTIQTPVTQSISPVIVYGEHPYLSIGSERWASMKIEQSGKIYEKTGKILMFSNVPFQIGNARITISGNWLSSDSSLDQRLASAFSWSGNVVIDRTHERIWERLVSLRTRKSIGTMQFRIKTGIQVKSKYYLTTPNGNVIEYVFPSNLLDSSGFLKTNQTIVQNFPISESGIYKIETVQSNGIAYFNLPISKNIFWSIIEPITQSQKITLRNDKNIIDKSILKKINVIRAGLRLNALVQNNNLTDLAQKKALDMATYNYVGHVTAQGLGILDFADSLNISVSGSVWENVAWWNISDMSLQDGLEESGSHRYNMINPKWKSVGIGYVLKDGKTYLVQVFGE